MTGLVIDRYVISRQKTLVCGRQTRKDYLQKTDTLRTNYITSLHSQYNHGLTDRRPITSRRN